MAKEYLNYDAIRDVQDAARQAFDKPDRKGMLKEFAVGARMSKTVPSVPAAVGHVVEKTAMSHQ